MEWEKDREINPDRGGDLIYNFQKRIENIYYPMLGQFTISLGKKTHTITKENAKWFNTWVATTGKW